MEKGTIAKGDPPLPAAPCCAREEMRLEVNPSLTRGRYPPAMPSPPLRLTIAACCLLAAMPAAAITVTRVEVDGLDDELMAENVRVS